MPDKVITLEDQEGPFQMVFKLIVYQGRIFE